MQNIVFAPPDDHVCDDAFFGMDVSARCRWMKAVGLQIETCAPIIIGNAWKTTPKAIKQAEKHPEVVVLAGLVHESLHGVLKLLGLNRIHEAIDRLYEQYVWTEYADGEEMDTLSKIRIDCGLPYNLPIFESER